MDKDHRRGGHAVKVKRSKALHRRTYLKIEQENKVRDVLMERYAKNLSENENTFGRRQDARQADERRVPKQMAVHEGSKHVPSASSVRRR